MTPHKKAKKLVDKFWKNGDKGLHQSNTYINFKCAKQCALICVDEIENELHYCNLKDDWCQECNVQTVKEKIIYWQEVKKEIEKLRTTY